MKVLQNYYNCRPFGAIKKETGASNVQEDKSDMDYFVNKTFEVLSQRVENEVPENGKYKPIAVSFKIPESVNTAKMIVGYDEVNPKDFRRLFVGVQRTGYDKMESYQLLKGTKKEILEYLNNPLNKGVVFKYIEELSKNIDSGY